MTKYNPLVDAYILNSQEFAVPILDKLRKIIHQACPEVEEKIKWSFPHFDYHSNMLCSFASFKHHCAFNFWLAEQLEDPDGILIQGEEKSSMGVLGKITHVKDLPPNKILLKYIQEAMKLSDAGAKLIRKREPTKELIVPDYFNKALSKNKKAKLNFEAFPPSHRKEYLQWIIEAKTEATRERRINQALEMISEGKGRNSKYEKN